MAIKPIDLEKSKGKADNIYEAIVIMSKRSRQINEELKIEFNQRIETLQAKTYDQEEEPDQPQINPDQILIAQEFELRSNPTESAIDDMTNNKLDFRYKENEQEAPTT